MLFLFLFIRIGTAQEYHQLSEEDKWKVRLQSRILVDIDQLTSANLPSVLNGRSPLAVLISHYRENQQPLLQQLFTKKDSLVILSEAELDLKWPEDIWVPRISLQDVEVLKLNPLPKENIGVKFKQLKELGALYLPNEEMVADSIFMDIWRQSARMPNFIKVDPELFGRADSIIIKLNARNKVFGAVRSKDGLLAEVYFKRPKNLVANGYFSMPIDLRESLPVFVPHKAGYYFSPDIIFTTPENRDNLKEFTGFPLDFEYGLTDYFVFGTDIKNIARKNNRELIANNLAIIDDPTHTKVGFFGNGAYVDAGLDSRNALQGSFTISAWVKPTVLNENNSILGKGENFVLKLHNGFLTFTMAGIKDYISKASAVPLGKWTHVALVHSKVNNELLFFVNGQPTDKIKLIEDYDTSDYNILIGSNLWQEFFNGYLGNIKIWERELNANEITKEYQGLVGNELEWQSNMLVIWMVLGTVVLVFVVWWFWNRIGLGKNNRVLPSRMPKKESTFNGRGKDEKNPEKILCFGSLRILTEDGNDIAKRLSPKLKQLFVIVLLHSIGDKKGISTKKLTEALWPGVGPKNAKNTRGTNIQNLRAILSASKEINLTFKDKNWFLELGDNCYCDYQEVLDLMHDLGLGDRTTSYLEQRLPKLLAILKEGRFLANMSDSWLDPFVEKMSNSIIEFCWELSNKLDADAHNVLLYDLASVMYIYDDLNENALQIKLQILIRQGKLSLARTVYDNFVKLYEKIYGESYALRFEEMVISNSSEKQ